MAWLAATRWSPRSAWLQPRVTLGEPIDVVYTWVNGSDPAFLGSLMAWRQRELDAGNIKAEDVPVPEALTGGSRYRDNEELRYSLRSVYQYASWVRNIYLVTNGQVPCWLDLSHPQIHVIPHSQIFTNTSHLPTFSSPAIEVHLHRIPGLSNKFIYFNDDVFLMQPVWPDDFYTLSGGQKLYFAWEVPPCAKDCNAKWLGDGYCDKPCNVTACSFDFGDCANVTATPATSYGSSGSSGSSYCSTGCMFTWIGDRYCDPHCLSEECGFDGGDCGVQKQIGHMLAYDDISWGHQTLEVPLNASSAIFNLSRIFPTTDITQATHSDRQLVRSATLNGKSKALTVVFGRKGLAGPRNVTVRIKGYGLPPSDGLATPLPANATAGKGKAQDRDSFDANILVNGMAISKYPTYRSASVKTPEHSPNHTLVTFDLVLVKTFPNDTGSAGIGRGGSSGSAGSAGSSHLAMASHSAYDHEWGDDELMWEPYDEFHPDLARRRLLAPLTPATVSSSHPGDAGTEQQPLSFSDSHIDAAEQQQKQQQQSRGMEQLVELDGPKRKLLDLFGDSLRFVDTLLSARYGPEVRKVPSHMPDMMDRGVLAELQGLFPAQYATTSSHRFRSPSDMQYAFSFFHFLKNERTDRDPSDVLREADKDGDRRLNDQELLTLILQVVAPNTTKSKHSGPHTSYGYRDSGYSSDSGFDRLLSRSEAEAWRQRLKEAVAAQEWFPGGRGIALSVLLDHKELTDHIWKRLHKENKYKTQLGDSKLSGFHMLNSDLGKLKAQLDGIRARPPRFLCLNDNFNDTVANDKASQEVRDFLQAMFPKPSPYELPPGRRGVTHVDEWRRVQLSRRVWGSLRAACLLLLLGAILRSCLKRRRRRRHQRGSAARGRNGHIKLLDV
ncbi:hypothetical protein WJX72_002047 [[Myrmecia] bisecta]|uniref:LNR domain-containing protein n=1 Tax=[Myrmecia] bisecta TaxID=41462 RepID=A0AAW1PNE5_9CHLO